MKNKKDLSGLAGNAAALLCLQIVSYIAPLLLIPYLTRTLGLDGYGVIAFGLAAAQIACVFTDYGFSLSATHTVAKNRDDKEVLSKTLGAVNCCKGILLILVAVSGALLIALDVKYVSYHIYFYTLLLAVAGQTFFPVWFFQGIERMLFITVCGGVSRAVIVILTFQLVSSPLDYWYVGLANGIGQLAGTVLAYLIISKLGYGFLFPSPELIKKTFKYSTQYFWGRAAAAAYAAGGTVFLGVVSQPHQAAIYAAAEQLYRGAVMLVAPLNQALYPYMVRTKNLKTFFSVLIVCLGVSICAIFVGLFISARLVEVIYGKGFEQASSILVMFMITFAVVVPSGLLGYPLLGAFGNAAAANKSVLCGGALQIALLGIIYYCFSAITAIHVAGAVLVVELSVLCYRIVAARATLNK